MVAPFLADLFTLEWPRHESPVETLAEILVSISETLLRWYDRHARTLPWRVSPGDGAKGLRADPYRVWLSEIMLQQTTVAAVQSYFEAFTTRWPTVQDLAAARDEDVMAAWAGLGYYARARNLLKCARVVAQRGAFPQTEAELLDLPGIGPYTAAAVAAIAFDAPATVVDGNVERVVTRYFAIEAPLPGSKPAIKTAAEALTPKTRPGDYAQAVMDLGATVCTPKSPNCLICPIVDGCAGRAAGIAAQLPAKTKKAPKPVRAGHIFVARDGAGAVLVERRPERGLLGGMFGFPGSDWSDNPDFAPPIGAKWRGCGEVRHTFTHFHLILQVHAADVPQGAVAKSGAFLSAEDFSADALPTVMKKAWAQAQLAEAL